MERKLGKRPTELNILVMMMTMKMNQKVKTASITYSDVNLSSPTSSSELHALKAQTKEKLQT